ncbi:hypothetical protein [Fluviicola taffensis]|uniref:hypothetical protein n=1 Tax=Fluviicola taffensis TaxID=191579 RepID=UPI00031BC8FB|nr:hypothetical protein [Fluviicola taffensis]
MQKYLCHGVGFIAELLDVILDKTKNLALDLSSYLLAKKLLFSGSITKVGEEFE